VHTAVTQSSAHCHWRWKYSFLRPFTVLVQGCENCLVTKLVCM
jgi:hypothetical protein